MVKNFKDETLEAINGREVDEYYIEYHPFRGDEDDPDVYDAIIFKGKSLDGKINFEELKSAIGSATLQYDRYGTAIIYSGWITFKGTQEWLSREEIYDSIEYWRNLKRPTLKNDCAEKA